MKKISVIVPVYGVEKYLSKCVESLLAQTYSALEIILVDDGSPDLCGKICDEYAQKDNRVVVIHKVNGGLSDARNAGIDVATGEYIAFVDSDDWIERDMYETLIKAAIDNSVKMAVGGVKVFDELTNTYRKDYASISIHECIIPRGDYIKEAFQGPWSAWDKIYHRSLFENVHFPVGEFNEDEAIMLSLIEQCDQIYVTNKPLYVHFVRTSESLTADSFSVKKIDWVKHCRKNYNYIVSHYPELIPYAKQRYISSLIWVLNNMTADVRQFSELIPVYRKELKTIIKEQRWNEGLSKKEILRTYLLAYLYYPYARMVCLLGKHYT